MSLRLCVGLITLVFLIFCFDLFYFKTGGLVRKECNEEETKIIVRDASELSELRNKVRLVSEQITLLLNQSEAMALRAADLSDKLSNDDIPDLEKQKIEEELMAIVKDLKRINSKLDKHKIDLLFWTDEFEKVKEEFIRKYGPIEDIIEKIKKSSR